MQALCGLQGIFDLFNCKTPESIPQIQFLFHYIKIKLFFNLLFDIFYVDYYNMIRVKQNTSWNSSVGRALHS